MFRAFTFIILILPLSAFGQAEKDSLLQALSRPDDSLKVHTYLALWSATEYIDNTESIEYARAGLSLSKRIKYTFGEALCLQFLGNSKSNKNDEDSMLYYYRKSIARYRQLKNEKQIATIYGNISGHYQYKGDYDQVEIYLDSLEDIVNSLGETGSIANLNSLKGNLEYYRGNYQLALSHYLSAEKYFADSLGELHHADLLVLIANTYAVRENYQKAIEALVIPEQVYKRNTDDYYLAQLYNNKGNIYLELAELDSAKRYLKQSEKLALKSENFYILVNVYGNLGKYQSKIGDLDSAFFYHTKSNEIAFKHDILQEVAAEYYAQAKILLAHKQFAKGLVLLDSATVQAERLGSKTVLTDIYRLYSDIYTALGNEKRSYHYFRLYDQLKDSIYNIEKSKQMAEMEAIYENEKKTREIALKNKDILILSRDLKIESGQRKLFLTIGISSIVLLLFSIIGYRRKIKKDKKLRSIEKLKEEEQRKNLELEAKLLGKELEHKKREITSYAINLIKKNEFLENIGQELKNHTDGTVPELKNKVNRLVQSNKQFDQEWDKFRIHFEEVHHDFFEKVKILFPDITPMEVRLASFIKLNLSTKEIASIMNVEPESIKKARYRLKKKMAREDPREISEILLEL